VITSLLTPELAEALLAYHAARYTVSLLLIGDSTSQLLAPTLPGITVHYLGGASRWEDLRTLPAAPPLSSIRDTTRDARGASV
jgi:hypothetical protein